MASAVIQAATVDLEALEEAMIEAVIAWHEEKLRGGPATWPPDGMLGLIRARTETLERLEMAGA